LAFERTLVTIRERPLAELLDLALVVVRRKPIPLGLAALGGAAPFLALNTWVFEQTAEAPGIPLLLWLVEAPFATAPLTLVLGNLMFGRRSSPREVVATLGRSIVPLFVIHGLFRLIPLVFWVPPRLAFANEVVLLEKGRWWRIWGRGNALIHGRSGALFALALLQVAAILLFAFVSYVATGRLGEVLFSEPLTWDVPASSAFAGPRFQLPIWLGVAFFAVARFLAYIDQRIRLEGWEVELRLRDVGRAMEEARRW